MNKLTRQELDDRLLDYLYDELEPSERSAFERALPEHPEIVAEVEAHRATRKVYAVLPREVAPPGLLANVLLEAEAEATRRTAVAKRVPWWDKARRVLFQPTFAMAAAVLMVAGISYVSVKKDRLPGMEPAPDTQHIPPVAMAAPSTAKVAERDVGEAAEGAAVADGKPLDELPAAPPTPAPVVAGVAADFEAKADPAATMPEVAKNSAPRKAVVAAEPAKDLARPAQATTPKLAAEIVGNEGTKQASGGGERAGLMDGDGVDDALVEGDAERRPLNTGNVAPRAPAETWATPTPPDDARKKTDSGIADTATTFDKAVEAPKREEPRKPSDAPPVKAPATKEKATPSEPPPAEAERRVEEVQVTRDDKHSGGDAPKPATLTPPAPSPEALWATYRKQDTAGAYADALASIEALAKLEGESTRVKEARAALRNKLATTRPPTTDKVPPDPPVQAPK